MKGSSLGLLLPEALVRIQFVTTTKPLIIEYLGTPAGKYGALAAALYFILIFLFMYSTNLSFHFIYPMGK